jgi:hypothetical protein
MKNILKNLKRKKLEKKVFDVEHDISILQRWGLSTFKYFKNEYSNIDNVDDIYDTLLLKRDILEVKIKNLERN